MSSGVSSDAGGESKTAAKGDEGRAGYIVHPGGDAVPKKVDTVVVGSDGSLSGCALRRCD